MDNRSSYSEAMQTSYAAKVRRAHLAREIIEVVLLIGIIFVAIKLGVETYGLSLPAPSTPISSSPMSPAINYGQNVIVSKLSYFFGSPQRGDVIIYDNPVHASDAQAENIGRIIGVPGDTIIVNIASVTVNGHVLTESYSSIAPGSNQGTPIQQKLGKDQYFVMNDNRSFCVKDANGVCEIIDSRNPAALGVDVTKNPNGSLDRKYIVGKVTFVYWPFNKMHGIDTYPDTFKGL